MNRSGVSSWNNKGFVPYKKKLCFSACFTFNGQDVASELMFTPFEEARRRGG